MTRGEPTVPRRFRVALPPAVALRWDDGAVAGSVLVVDDDAAVRGLVVRILRSWGHVVIGEAGSVAEALRRAATMHPDIVLVDIGLPDGDGFALTPQLRTRCRASRVVLFSSDADRANARGRAARRGGRASCPRTQLPSPALRRLLEEGADGADRCPRPLRVAIGEDDVLLREGIARILVGRRARRGGACRRRRRPAARGRSAYRPDVVVVDVQMPPRPRGRRPAAPRWSCAAACPRPACSSCRSSASPPTRSS